MTSLLWGFSYFLAQLFLSGKAICHCYTHQLFVDGVSADYLEVLSWRRIQRPQLAVKTIPASSVAAVILSSQRHGSEPVRSALPAQCSFQADSQWGLYVPLLRSGHISSFLLGVSLCPSFHLVFSSSLSPRCFPSHSVVLLAFGLEKEAWKRKKKEERNIYMATAAAHRRAC